MHIDELIRAIEAAVPPGAAAGTRHHVEGRVDTGAQTHGVSIAMRIDASGRRRETWLCDGVRVEPPLLMRLTCAETDCPQSRQAQRDWTRFLRRRQGLPGIPAPADPHPEPDVGIPSFQTGVRLESGALQVEARPDRFRAYLNCPNRAHPSLSTGLPGYDVFEGCDFVTGGVQQTLHDGTVVAMGPRVRRLDQVQALLDDSRDAADQAIHRAAARARP